jgi:two-component system, NtrC family, sensor kinase
MSLLLLFIVLSISCYAQSQPSNHIVDSLTRVLNNHPKEDSVRVDILATLSVATTGMNVYQPIAYLNEALRITQKNKNKQQEAGIRIMLGFGQMEMGESIKSIENFQAILDLGEIPEGTRNLALNFIGLNYKAQGDLDKAFEYSKEADKYKTDDPRNIFMQPYNYGDIYYKKNQIDSALKYGKTAFQNISLAPQWAKDQFASQISCLLGNTYNRLNQKDSAYFYINYALQAAAIHTDDIYFSLNKAVSEIESQLSLAKWFDKWGSKDSVYISGTKAYHRADEVHNYDYMQQSALFLKSVYLKEKKYEQALTYNDLAIAAKDSLQGVDKVKKTQAMHYDYQLKEQQLDDLKKQLSLKSRIRLLFIFSGFFVLFIIFLYRTIHQRKKTIRTLNEQNNLIENQKKELNGYLVELKEKQTQLVHAEKMASLGELTAGIAHEIQNPLNFVNNFSELNTELIEELKTEQAKSVRDLQLEDETLGIIEENSKKILLHGKRAESIVRSMLEHSQTKPGEKNDTNINTLTEEYLKLSYHAIRAKDKSFNVNMITELDPAIPNLKIIPADIGRVLINIFNNAFYSMNEKRNKPDEPYSPSLSIRSLIHDKTVDLIIKDNGPGIPKAVLSKIFQPFFTTKPTGNGTGLGLSLSYDIVTKAHGGSISVDSVEGEYCTFIISLPV